MTQTLAARIHKYGNADEVRVESVTLSDPEAGAVLVRVHAAGLNPVDWKIRAGYLQQVMPLPLPITLGGDFSGVVEGIGPEVTGYKIGDEVFGQAPAWNGTGSFAEAVIAKTGSIAAKPRTLPHTEAAALPLVGASALQALTDHLRVTAGQKILIHGGAGGIGSVAIQLAKQLGAEVATTVATSDVAYAKSLGADTVVDYTKQGFEDVVRDFDAVLDTVGGETYTRSFAVLKKGGRLASMLERPDQDLAKNFGVEASMVFTQVTSERLARLAELARQGELKIKVEGAFPLAQARAALASLEKGATKGKIVLNVAA